MDIFCGTRSTLAIAIMQFLAFSSVFMHPYQNQALVSSHYFGEASFNHSESQASNPLPFFRSNV